VLAALFLAAALQTPAMAQTPAQAQTPGVEAARRVVATLQLAAQEYRLAWKNGVIANAAEWNEAKLFVAEARQSAGELPDIARVALTAQLATLERRLAQGMPADSLATEAQRIERDLSNRLGESLDDRPAREPSLASGARIFRQRCASCHGTGGRGDGAAAVGLTPPPANLTDAAILASVTPLDFYRRITHGTPGTAMVSFASQLTKEERWDVVAHVFALTDTLARQGRTGQLAVVFGSVRGTLGGALDLAARGDAEAAGRKVLDAYMAFEAVEGSLSATDPGIVKNAEQHFTALRLAAASRQPASVLGARHAELLATLRAAEAALTEKRSATGLFLESVLLLLREGFEAILVVGAIMAVLIRAGAREKQKSVRWGVVAALAASLATAAVLEVIFRVTPAQREALEGGIMLAAALMLFYVSYWLISKVEGAAWARFVKDQILKAVDSGSGLGLAGVAFLAVYREGFETVLFYKALYVTGGSGGAAPITVGIVVGLVGLVALFVGIERFGLRIPMRPFFAVTSATLAFMAFVFAGDGVKELQEGGYISTTLVPWAPRADFFGVYPTVESLAVQGAILTAILAALAWTFFVLPRRTPALETPGDAEPPMERAARRTGARKAAGA